MKSNIVISSGLIKDSFRSSGTSSRIFLARQAKIFYTVIDSSVPLIHHSDRSWITDPDPDHPKGMRPSN